MNDILEKGLEPFIYNIYTKMLPEGEEKSRKEHPKKKRIPQKIIDIRETKITKNTIFINFKEMPFKKVYNEEVELGEEM